VLFALVYLLLRRVVGLIAGSSHGLMETEVELVVLRHQLKVLKRQAGRPRLRRSDRLFLAAIARALPRARWSSFFVSPQTLLRWHRELVRRKWTFRRRSSGGRPPIPGEVRELILRMEGRTPGGAASGSVVSSPSLVSGCLRPRFAPCCGRTDWSRPPAETVRPGASSSVRKPRGSWPSTSSLSRRRGFARCTCCSRSTTAPGSCASSVSPRTRTRRGSRSRSATWRWGSGLRGFGS
jgi:hypothetical protein